MPRQRHRAGDRDLEPSRGIRLIVGYKLGKGVLEAVFASVLTALTLARHGGVLVDVARQLHDHLTGAWSNRLAELAMALAAAPQRLWRFVLALALDATLTVLEGLALVRGAWWGPWVVVVATGALVPFEIAALVHHLHAGRVVLLGVNVIIVGYLARRALAARAQRP
jgi:uncharacterized membrane protein (DUF2068 family)